MIRKLLLGFLALLALAVLGAVAWYELDYVPRRYAPAAPEAIAALSASDTVDITRERWIVMRPRSIEPRAGLIFYPGGDVDPVGYSEPLRKIAEAGYLVVNVPMPLTLAVLSPDRADDVIAAFPEVRTWAIAGHSLGGSMAARYVAHHPGKIAGLLLWDAYADPADDLSAQSLAVRQIHRLEPDGSVPEAYRAGRNLLPASAEIITLPGAIHMNYGRFITPAERARMSPPAAMPVEDQHERVAALSVEFLSGLTPSPH